MTENLTVIIPFYEGHDYIDSLLNSLPASLPVVIVDDQSTVPLTGVTRPNTTVYRPGEKLYFTGAVNYAIDRTSTDVLILNQDVTLTGVAWLDLIEENRATYALIGERIKGEHPAFPHGYVHGVFQFMRRDAIDTAGNMDAVNYPLWGASALWQWQICRAGFASLPVVDVPGLHHQRTGNYGSSIQKLLADDPNAKSLFVRTPPLISVVIPSYNHGRYLRDAINSLIGGPTSLGDHPGQTLQSFEIIVVDDASSDDTPAIMAELASAWQGIRYIRRETNGGTPAANNTGIRAAIGQTIVMMCADDMREPWSLNDLYQTMRRNPGHVIYDDPTTFADGKRLRLFPLANYDFNVLLERNMMHMGIMFERKAWAHVGGYPELMKQGREDWAFNVALGAAGHCGIKVERSGYLYRREGQNRTLTNVDWDSRQMFVAQMRSLFPDLYKGQRSMSCCGGKTAPGTARSSVMARGMAQVPGGDVPNGMTLVEYTGRDVGTSRWGGPGGSPSGRYYNFGNNTKDKVKYVANADLDWVLALRDSGRTAFVRYDPPVPTPVTIAETEPVIAEELVVDFPDPSTMTVADIKALDLDEAQWAALADAEMNGKSRRSVLEYAKSIT